MVTDVKYTYSGSHFSIYTNIKSLCSISETNIMLPVNYISIIFLKEKKTFFQSHLNQCSQQVHTNW